MTSVIANKLKGKSVLVTGATGFVGSHLAERLAVAEQANVTGGGRKLDAARFLADAGVNLQKADLLDRDAMHRIVAGQDIIFHVAAWLSHRSADAERARQINADATVSLIDMAAVAGVSRLVLVSSIAVYGPLQQGEIDENHPVDPQQDDLYGRTKALGEVEARAAAERTGVELVIVRPGMIYGPRSYSWTLGMAKLVRRGIPTIFGKGDGHVHPVYIDNLIDLLLLAAVEPQAAGETFNAVDGTITWRRFFGYYSQMLDKKLRQIPFPLARVIVVFNRLLNLGLPISRERLLYYASHAVFSTARARALLGYHPQVDIDEGMQRSERWLREAGHIAA